jgi:uncharacterized protein involved in exopolysaccharide biosynthesis
MSKKLRFHRNSPEPDEPDNTAINESLRTGEAESQMELFNFIGILLKRRTFIAGFIACIMVLTAIYIFIMPNMYRSTATILPSGQMDKLSAVKELAGLGNLVGNINDNSSQLFPVILRSNQVKDALATKQFNFEQNDDFISLTLSEYLGEDNPDYLCSAVDGITEIQTDKKTGIITVSIETKYPQLSQKVLIEMLAELENFNLFKRKSQAAGREKYLARELVIRDQELKEAESELEEFQSSNRDWYGSSNPEILRTFTDLQRDTEIKSKTYLFLKEQYEIARLDVQKDIPVVSILDQPSFPTIKSGPFRIRIILLSGIISFLLAMLLVAVEDFFRRIRHGGNRASIDDLKQEINVAFPVINRIRRQSQTPTIS